MFCCFPAWEISQLLEVQEARFLMSASTTRHFVAANESLVQLTGVEHVEGSQNFLKSICSDTAGLLMLEETISKARSGSEGECSLYLRGYNACCLVSAIPVVDNEKINMILCAVTPIEGSAPEAVSYKVARAIYSCATYSCPCLVEDANDEWCSLWGFSKDTIVGQNIYHTCGAKTDELALAELTDRACRGLTHECDLIGQTARGSNCAVHLRCRPILQHGLPLTHSMIEAAARKPLPSDEHDAFCERLASLDVFDFAANAGGSGTDSDADAADARPRAFAELVLPLPPDAHRRACVALLRRLRALALVRGWRREGGALRIRADAEALAGLAGARPLDAAGAGAWLHRLAEAARAARSAERWRAGRRAAAGGACGAEAEAGATDFSFLSCDAPRGSPQLVPVN